MGGAGSHKGTAIVLVQRKKTIRGPDRVGATSGRSSVALAQFRQVLVTLKTDMTKISKDALKFTWIMQLR
jgi:hypothetical protein